MDNLKLQILTKENQINKVLKNQKETKEDMKILFVSPWCGYCETLLDSLDRTLPSSLLDGDDQSLYLVNSFQMPHAFVIYKVRKTPCLVSITNGRIRKEDYLPRIYEELEL